MKTTQTKQKHGGQGALFNWRWIALLALLACLMADRSTAGTLTATSIPIINTNKVYLSAEGDLDWAQWGTFTAADFNQKAGVASQISNFTPIGGSAFAFGNAAANSTWVDGSIDKVIDGRTAGLFVNSPAGNGFQLVIQASATARILNLYLGTFNAQGKLDLALSDGTTLSLTNLFNSRYTITFADSTPSATLTVSYVNLVNSGNVTLMAASLATATSLPLSVGTPTLSCPSSVKVGSTFDLLVNPLGVAANGTTAFAYQWRVDGVDIPGATSNPYYGATAGSVGVHNYDVVITNSVLGTAVTSAPVALTVTAPGAGALSVSAANLPAASPPTFTALDVNLTAEGVIDWAHWGFINPTDYDNKNATIGNYTQIGTDTFAPFNSTVSFSWTDATTANNPVSATLSSASLPVTNGFVLNIPASSTSNRLVHIYVGVSSGAGLRVVAQMSDGSAPIFSEYNQITSGTRRYTILFQAASAGQTLNVTVSEPQRTIGNGRIALLSAALQPVPPLSVSTLVADPGTSVLVNQPMVVSVAPFQPQGAPPFNYQWRRDTGSGLTNVPGATGSSLSFTAGSTVGNESCDVIITGSQGSITSAPVVLTRSAATGILKLLSVEPTVPSADLTQEGGLDWSHWGFALPTDFNQKAAGGSLIGNFTLFGPSTSLARFGSGVSYRWTDGTPNLAATNNSAVYRFPAGNGFELNVAAAQTNRLLHVYLGSFQAVAHVEAYLSDNSAIKLIDESLPAGGNGRYNIQFAAGSPGQTLIFRVWFNSGGNVTLGAASLEGIPALVAGTPGINPTNVVPAGSSITLQVQGASGVPPLKYQWQLDSGGGYAALPGATNANVPTSAGNVVGSKSYRVVVSDVTGSVTSAPVTLTVTTPTSTLAGNRIFSTGLQIDLSGEGSLDWVHWGNGGIFAQKDTLPALISPFAIVGTGPVQSYGGGVFYNWTNGTPETTGIGDGRGIYLPGAGNGFALDVPAAASERVFTVYCGVYQATMHMEAMMSDNSAPIFVDETLSNAGGTTDARYSFRYSSPNPSAVLQVRYWDLAGANVTLQAATLGSYVPVAPGSIQVQAVSGGQLQLTWNAGTLEEAPTVNGPWTANSAISPYTFTPTGAQKYFRTAQAPF